MTTTQTLVGTPTLPRVNLLPTEIDEARKVRQAQVGLGAVVVLAVVGVGGLYYHAHGGVSSAQSDLQTQQDRNTQLQAELRKHSYVTTVKAQVAAAEASLQQAMGQQISWSAYLGDLELVLPGNVWLKTLDMGLDTGTGGAPAAANSVPTVGHVNVSGTAVKHNDVAAMLTAFGKERGFANAYFTNSSEKNVPNTTKTVTDFQASVGLTSKAYTGRYLTAGE